MSLGPPFDDSGERLQLSIGAAAGVVLVFVTAFALLAAERSLGESLNFHVQVARPGALHTGAQLRVAGEPIGEVVAIRGRAADFGRDEAPVDIEVRLQTKFRDRVFRNSTIVAVNPTLLTEALLEVGPPAGGAAPADPVRDGDKLRGVDPADIDQFMFKVYVSVEAVLHETRDLQPEWAEFQRSISAASTQFGETMPADKLLRIGLHAASIRLHAGHLSDVLREADFQTAPDDVKALYRSSQPLVAELSRLATNLDLLQGRASALSSAIGPRQREIARAIAGLRSAIEVSGRVETDARALIKGVENGRGALGGFYRDIQIFDELKEMHRILKRRGWRILIKRPDAGQRNLR